MEHCGYVTQINNLRPHSNADKLQLTDIFGNTVCVDLNTKIGDIGVYFPADLQLSVEFCEKNNLIRKLDENGVNVGGYLEPDKRNIRSLNLRGEKSDGLFMPLSAFEYTGAKLEVGDTVTILNGHEICQKYIPYNAKRVVAGGAGARVKRRAKRSIAPTFFEHADTAQLIYNMDAFKPGDEVEITLKMHGTSQRTGCLKILKGYKRTFWDKITKREGTPIYDWGYVSGTRRTVLENFDDGFYGSDKFRKPHADFFEGKLHKGETVYYEVVGFTDDGTPIMSSVENSKIRNKAFTKQYGKTTIFSYGCAPDGRKVMHGTDGEGNFEVSVDVPKSDFYVYRMTMTNEDGDVVEYTPDFMRYRCDQMGAKYVMPFWRGILEEPDDWTGNEPWTAGEYLKSIAEDFYDGPDPVGKTHVREGVVCRIVNRPTFTAYKHKNFSFKVLEGIAKDEADAPDMEEAQEEIVNVEE